MKTSSLALLLLPVCASFLASCETSSTTAANTQQTRPGVELTSEKKSYTQEELRKRGRPTVGGALEAQDPSIQVTGH
jgi:hypothetical protein